MVVKISGDASLCIRQVGKHGPVAGFGPLGSEAGSAAFSLGIAVALAAAAMRELCFGIAQQGFVDVAHVLSTPVGADS